MIEWVPVSSSRIVAAAYDQQGQRILVEFPNGVRWWYGECSGVHWEELMAPGQSKGQYIHEVLDGHPKGRLDQ